MQLKRLLVNPVSALLLAACAFATSAVAHADTIAWTSWSSATSGNPGSATGTIGSINVTYSGQTSGLTNTPSWAPASTFTGGVVGNAPPLRPPFKLREDRASPRPSASPPPSSILSLRYGVSVNPDFRPPLTSPPRVVNPSMSSAVALLPNSAAALSPPSARSSTAPKATVSSSSWALSTPSPSPRPT